jgi:hypothetical protein
MSQAREKNLLMRQKTQTTEYWQELTVEDSDLAFLEYLFLEKEDPLSTDELALAIIRRRCEAEEQSIRAELERGTIFQPRETYAVGDQLVFPALDFALGTVVGTRAGHNPEYGDFTVIQLEFQPKGRLREFASQLAAPHPLNFDGGPEGLLWSDEYLTPEELFELYGPGVRQKLLERLGASDDMVRFGDLWLNRAMMADIHVGHLNIAEAMIDVKATPLPTKELLKELDLPGEINLPIQVFSLNHALANEERFKDVGATGNMLWYLTRLIPPEVLYPPRRLQYSPIPHDRSVLSEELFQLEREIDDEASDLIAPPGLDSAKGVTFVLNYPHRRLGTLPLTAKTRNFFPPGTDQYTLVTLVDANSGTEMPGWVNHRHRYVYGLEQWYQDNNIPVGAFIQLGRKKDPFKITVSFKRRRMRREWVRVAEASDDELSFVVRKMPIACEYDETMLVWAEALAEVDALWIKAEESERPLGEIVKEVFLELAKLNPQGTVHAKTVYSAFNVVRRCPPAPIFAELVSAAAYIDVGDGQWRYVG